jgi:ribosomal protein S18 acetylase RimI-like enzyme
MSNTATAPLRESIGFRPYVELDVPFLRYLYGTTREDELRPVPWTDEQKRWFLDQQFSAQKAHYEEHYPDCVFLVIELEGQPIGRLYVNRGAEDIRIVDIALVPGHRGRGIGRMLMEEILAEGRATGKTVSIHVEHDNPAMRLYDRLGFHHVDTYGVYHLMEWRGKPELGRDDNRVVAFRR